MKKTLLFLSVLAATVSMSNATVTYQFSTTSNYATNFLSGSGANNSLMVWGIVVDAANNGFQGENAATPYDAGFTVTSAATLGGTVLNYLSAPTTSVASDDVLYISSNLMNLTTNTTDGATVGLNRITNLANISYTQPGVAAGDTFRVIWFNLTALGGTSADGVKYGMWDMPSLDTLQADPGTYPLAAASAGADTAKSMGFTLGVAVPEPSAALLGAVGALVLLRRRRI